VRLEFLTLAVLALIALISFLGILSETAKIVGVESPAFGGTLREGIVGGGSPPRFINPLLAQSDADRDLSALIYSGLFKYDKEGSLEPALAERYEISENGLTYTIFLKENIYWPDGQALTADDVVFTIQLAKNPLAQSPRRANWEGVEIEAADQKTIKFHLKKAYAPFLENLIMGILPRHLWENIHPSQIALAVLNTNPVGAGPYRFKSSKKDSQGAIASVSLTANKYYALGKPYIKNLQVYFYKDEESAFKNLQNGSLDLLGSVSPKNIDKINTAHYDVKKVALKRIIAVFLNQNLQKDFSSLEIRRALNVAVDKKSLIDNVLSGYGEIIDGPLPEEAQEIVYDPELARNILQKQKKEIKFTLTTIKTPELAETAEILKGMWEAVGFKVDIKTIPIGNLETDIIGPREYQAFLYGEEVIGKMPDPFAFWHSSQRLHPGYNIALYINSKVDKLLEDVRSARDKTAREKLYEDIQREIKRDLPAIFLYSPSYIYVVPKAMNGIFAKTMNTASDRFADIQDWYLNKSYIWTWTFLKGQ